jgi:quinol monooxygenase YgiN
MADQVTVIDADADVVTLINHFTVDPTHQRELVDLLIRATANVIRHRPGFITANIHASVDGTRVVNYAQWETEDAMRSMLADPVCKEHTDAALKISTAEPRLYTVESVEHR